MGASGVRGEDEGMMGGPGYCTDLELPAKGAGGQGSVWLVAVAECRAKEATNLSENS